MINHGDRQAISCSTGPKDSLFGEDGLVWAQPAADLVSFAVGIVMYVLTWHKMTGAEKTLMQAQS